MSDLMSGAAREQSLHIKYIPDGEERKGKHAEKWASFFFFFFFFKFKEKPTGFMRQDIRELTVMCRETIEIVIKNL